MAFDNVPGKLKVDASYTDLCKAFESVPYQLHAV